MTDLIITHTGTDLQDWLVCVGYLIFSRGETSADCGLVRNLADCQLLCIIPAGTVNIFLTLLGISGILYR